MTTKDYFENIFTGKKFDSQKYSGNGSLPEQTAELIKNIPHIIKCYNITTLLDVPCGDFEYMKYIYSKIPNYIGGDISENVINRNRSIYPDIDFRIINLKDDPLPQCDCILIRDLFVHLTYKEIKQCVQNIKKHNIKYILTTTFTLTGIIREPNRTDIVISPEYVFWQPINLQLAPLNFPKPLYLLNEKCTEAHNNFKDKSLGLWLVSSINI